MRHVLASSMAALLLAAASTTTRAQSDEDALPPPPPDATAETATAPPVAPLDSCTPACREGFLCHEGSCVSACNPPCDAGARCTATGACVLSAAPPPPFNPAPIPEIASPDEGIEQHDGFMLRLALGFGSGTMTWKDSSGIDEEYSGFAGSFSVDIGAAPTENLVLHGRISDLFIANPSVTQNGVDMGEIMDLSVGSVMFGAGVTYYFMPINLYVTGVIGPARMLFQRNGRDILRTEYGFGLNLDVGKEWWVGDQWGLGVALRLWYNSVSIDEDDLDLVSGTLMFSATYQ